MKRLGRFLGLSLFLFLGLKAEAKTQGAKTKAPKKAVSAESAQAPAEEDPLSEVDDKKAEADPELEGTTASIAPQAGQFFSITLGSDSLPNLFALTYGFEFNPHFQATLSAGYSGLILHGAVGARYLFNPESKWGAVVGLNLGYFSVQKSLGEFGKVFPGGDQLTSSTRRFSGGLLAGAEWRGKEGMIVEVGGTLAYVKDIVPWPYVSLGWRF
jgi:hypothetical protein